ncbi:MAG: nucleotide exchange factor GrpE [bacterium]|nr:nucleotide exchange factor GrpE [bacterium]
MTEEGGDVVEISYVPEKEDTVIEEPELKEKPKKTTRKKTSQSLKKLQKKISEQEEILEKVVEERDELKNKYLRSLAEVDNFRKRVQKEKEEYRKFVLADFILGLLEVFDNLERALNAASTEQKAETSILSGVEMIYKQLQDLLKKNKVKEIDSLGKPFDPNVHQALSKVEREGIAKPVILEVYQKGFMYNEKLLRPALAKVAIPKEVSEPEESTGDVEAEDGLNTDPGEE